MKKTRISDAWNFTDTYIQDYHPEEGNAEYVTDLPHDYAIRHQRRPDAPGRGSTGFYTGGVGKYFKYIKFENKQHTILDIDGAYMCAEVRLNTDLLAIHPHGYTPFLVDLTDSIAWGVHNKLEIRTNDHQPSSRWYSGAGLYRDVYLWTGGDVRIEPWDLYVVTNSADSHKASITIKTSITTDYDTTAELHLHITDKNGNSYEKSILSAVSKEHKNPVDIDFEIENPLLWDIENPNLYSIRIDVTSSGTQTDTAEQIFGIRSICYSTKEGFTLNGTSIKLMGGCIHHDHGGVGACAYPKAEERKIRKLKEAGFNAVRLAHNPPSTALLEVCDKLGMLVMDEAFDCWRNGKTANDYHLWFEDWWQRDLSFMVMRDRSHPCVISYSIGNEIYESNDHSDGEKWSKLLCDEVKKYDTTRPTTSGICVCFLKDDETAPDDYRTLYKKGRRDLGTAADPFDGAWDEWTYDYVKPLDIVGYNYRYKRYDFDSKKYPDRIIWGSETHTYNLYDAWQSILEHPNVLGDFTWTAIDNLGETGAGRLVWDADLTQPFPLVLHQYPWRTCWQGDLEITGFRRSQSYFREEVWYGNTEPKMFTLHPKYNGKTCGYTAWSWYDVCPSWTFDDMYIGENIFVQVYSTADEVRFTLNGKVVGSAVPEKAIATIHIPYEKGVLISEAIKDGKVIGTSTLKTIKEAAKIEVLPEDESIKADGRDLAYFVVNVTDADGNIVTDSEAVLSCSVVGGDLVSFFSGNPCNEDVYHSGTCHAFCGRALLVVKTKQPGDLHVTVTSEHLQTGKASVKSI